MYEFRDGEVEKSKIFLQLIVYYINIIVWTSVYMPKGTVDFSRKPIIIIGCALNDSRSLSVDGGQHYSVRR